MSDAPDDPKDDVAVIVGATPNAEHLAVVRKRGDSVEPALLTRTKEGQPINAELLRLHPRAGTAVCDVETLFRPPRQNSGPPQVATKQYREGWERLFKKPKRSRASN